jgi:hypothetical protein
MELLRCSFGGSFELLRGSFEVMRGSFEVQTVSVAYSEMVACTLSEIVTDSGSNRL